ncbi:DEAD/DEAH box helicase, partial [Propylenella binzhouense]|uniref:DEAD/DEAH box helicase n=1 Tax=Propylenella binzhouense TaxID=2555902 RepID=UPI001FEADDC5
MTSFSDFGLVEPIQRALSDAQYAVPTPIQTQAIPVVLSGRDLIGIAQTGTGKTAAFALPILNRLATEPKRPERTACRVLVLSPTRELAGQIEQSFRRYGKHVRLTTALAIGGVPIGRQKRALAGGVDVLVATPGRLLDLFGERALRLDRVETLVLDEADQMLDLGFFRDIRRIVAELPKSRLTLFFSATMPPAIAELAEQMLTDPARVSVTPVAKTADRVEQRVIHLDRAAKPNVLAEVLRAERPGRVLVFTRTKHGADKLVRALEHSEISAAAIHGNKSQPQRERVLSAFRRGEVTTLVATDIAARGIDVAGVSHVVNYDLPEVAETYVHRIGRTARAGAAGIAITLCTTDETPLLKAIEKLTRLSIPAEDRRTTVPAPAAAPRPGDREAAGNRPGARRRRRKPASGGG